MLSLVAGPLRLASVAICLIVTTSFVLFVVNQAGEASNHQVEALAGSPRAGRSRSDGATGSRATVGTRIEEVAKDLTSPFSGVTAGSSSQWKIRGVDLLLTLVVYGFGLGFLARVLRMH